MRNESKNEDLSSGKKNMKNQTEMCLQGTSQNIGEKKNPLISGICLKQLFTKNN